MGSVRDAYDNAMAESFFATLECELLAGATADLDRPCARRRQRRAGRDGKTNSAGAEQKNSRKQEDKMPSLQIP
jgi:hypothetical protein